MIELVLIHLVERQFDDLFYAVAADDGRRADVISFTSVFVVLVGGDGQDGFFIVEQTGDQTLERQADAIVGRFLAVDDLIGGIARLQVDVLQVFQFRPLDPLLSRLQASA